MRAVTPTPRGGLGACPRSHFPQSRGLPHGETRSAPPPPRHRFRSGEHDDAAVFALCYGPRGCLPSCPGLTWSVSPAIEDVYIRAFPRPSRLGLESDMTTRRYRVSTVTGLSPVGTLPLQAAPLRCPSSTRIRLRLAVWHSVF
jgi:hypothetical protein